MPKSALPERLQDPANWQGTDDDVWYMRWRIPLKGLFAYGPRATQWWARWAPPPKVLLKVGGQGPWRVETDPWSGKRYLSRIQYWKRWHLQISWPFLIAFHIYFRNKNVPKYLTNPGDTVNNKLFYFYFGSHFDQDSVYWFPSAYLGLTWK